MIDLYDSFPLFSSSVTTCHLKRSHPGPTGGPRLQNASTYQSHLHSLRVHDSNLCDKYNSRATAAPIDIDVKTERSLGREKKAKQAVVSLSCFTSGRSWFRAGYFFNSTKAQYLICTQRIVQLQAESPAAASRICNRGLGQNANTCLLTLGCANPLPWSGNICGRVFS